MNLLIISTSDRPTNTHKVRIKEKEVLIINAVLTPCCAYKQVFLSKQKKLVDGSDSVLLTHPVIDHAPYMVYVDSILYYTIL